MESLVSRHDNHRNGLALRPAVLRVKTLALAEALFAEPDQHRDVAVHRELGLLPANAQVENCAPTFEHFAQLGFAEMTLNSRLRDLEPCGDFPLSRAYAGKLLDLGRVKLGARSAVRPSCRHPTTAGNTVKRLVGFFNFHAFYGAIKTHGRTLSRASVVE